MEAIIFCGIQGAGKSTFYKERFFATHLRINLDMLRTRRREKLILDACLAGGQRFVVDNTNPTSKERRVYIEAAKAKHFSPICYYFDIPYDVCLRQNNLRTGKACVSEKGLAATSRKLQKPEFKEGFEKLFSVSICDDKFVVGEISNEV